MLFDVTGKVALVTGSSRGIGRAIAERLAEAGAKVVISARNAEPCDEVVAAIRARGGEAIAHAANVSDRAALESLVAAANAAYGKIDILVCNAAANPYYGPLLGIDDRAFDKIMATNVRSVVWLCSLVVPAMAERGDGGSVILISSIAGLKGTTSIGAYGISKAADSQIVRNLALEYGPQRIRVNALAPAVVRTEFARRLWDDPVAEAQTSKRYPLGRIGEPDDVAGAAVFLASRAGEWITGQTIVIDGGSSIAWGE